MIKWFATLCVILAAGARAFNQHIFDLVLSILGAGVWAYVAYRENDKALLTVNGFILAILAFGIFK